jgi:hypothetical protein
MEGITERKIASELRSSIHDTGKGVIVGYTDDSFYDFQSCPKRDS